ncbi:MAG: hypothetical protein ACAH17_02825 [Candidatus Paceibacterota bacterium]
MNTRTAEERAPQADSEDDSFSLFGFISFYGLGLFSLAYAATYIYMAGRPAEMSHWALGGLWIVLFAAVDSMYALAMRQTRGAGWGSYTGLLIATVVCVACIWDNRFGKAFIAAGIALCFFVWLHVMNWMPSKSDEPEGTGVSDSGFPDTTPGEGSKRGRRRKKNKSKRKEIKK